MKHSDDLQEQLEATFLSEADEIILELEKNILNLENDHNNSELHNSILRHAHTLKGSSGMVGPDPLPTFIHHYEEVVKDILNDHNPSKEVYNFMLKELDFIKFLIEELVQYKKPLNESLYNEHLQNLKTPDFTPKEKKSDSSEVSNNNKKNTKIDNADQSDNEQSTDADTEENSTGFGFFEDEAKNEKLSKETMYYRINFKLNEDRMECTWLPESLIDDINKIGTILHIKTVADQNVSWKDFDYTNCHFQFIIIIETNHFKEDIEDIFIFFKDNNEISIELLNKEDMTKLGEILVSQGVISHNDLDSILDTKKRIGEILEEEKKVSKDDIENALQIQDKFKKSIKIDEEIKISTKKVDVLIDLVGELVIANSNLNNISNGDNEADLDQIQYNINKISRQMRDVILSLKMVPIGQLLTKYFRMVRDLSNEFGKEISLNIEGESTELDKSMFDVLQEPLLHLIRNAIDHGLETPEDREKIGKKREGRITISAYHENGQVVIEVRDDGRGLDQNRILSKGIEKGILKKDGKYSEEEILNVIFHPGFSTKDQTSLISGRGIGMDAVKSGIKKLNGSIKTKTIHGKGTTFIITLPLTLAIIEGFLVRVGKNYFVFPLNFIHECFEEKMEIIESKGMSYNLRGEYLSIIDLTTFFSNIEYDSSNSLRKQIVVLEIANGSKSGILVDEIIGDIQAVIKPLAKVVNKSNIITGSTLLGSGEVALILDVANIFEKFKTIRSED